MKFLHLTNATQLLDWAKTLINQLNGQGDYVYNLTQATDDADAATKGVAVGFGYRGDDGFVHWRVS